MNYFLKIITVVLLGIGAPVVAYAQNPMWVNSLIDSTRAVLTPILGVLVGLALLLFIWGLVKFIISSGDENAIAEGKMIMFWGVIALFVIVSSWGIVALMQQVFGTPDTTPTPPRVQF